MNADRWTPGRGTSAVLAAALVWTGLAGCAGGRPTSTSSPTPPLRPTPSRPPEHSPTPVATLPGDRIGPRVFLIVPEESSASFRVDEVLRNRPNTVVGTTGQIGGEIRVDPADPGGAWVGPITIDARSFVTDNELRDSSIRGLILESALFPEIVFDPTVIAGLPAEASVGSRLTFEITGDLTIRSATRSEAFRVVLEVVAADRLEGQATTTVRRADYGLTIPSVPQVAEVGEEVELRLRFTAIAEP